MGEEWIAFYEKLEKVSACFFVASFFMASFLAAEGKLWTTVRTLKNEKKKKRGKRRQIQMIFLIFGCCIGQTAELSYAQEEDKFAEQETWEEQIEWNQEMELSASSAQGEWFSGEESYKIFVKVTGEKPDQICFSWEEGEEEKTGEIYETVWEEGEIYEYEIVFHEKELESLVQIWAVTDQEITCISQWKVQIDRMPPETDVIMEYREGENVFLERWGAPLAREIIYFRNEMEITVYAHDNMSGVACVTFEADERFVEGQRGEKVQIDGKLYDSYHAILCAPADGNIANLAITDEAGNCILLEEMVKFVVDAVPPSGEILVCSEEGEKEQIAFFQDTAQIRLQISEEYWKGQKIPIWVNGQEMVSEEEDWVWIGEQLHEKVMCFEEEGKYQICFGPVFDLSGNQMAKTEEKVVVVDRTAPRIKKMEIKVDGNLEEGVWYTKNGKIEGKICIEEEWFDPEKMGVYLWNQETGEKQSILTGWDWEQKEAWGYFQTGEIEKEGIYRVVVSGTDRAGNLLECGPESGKERSNGYSEPIVVDRTPPLLCAFVLEEIKGEKEGILYFQEQIQGSFWVDEARGLKSWSLMQMDDSGRWKAVGVQWQNREGKFKLDKREGSTKLLINAEDFAGNQLTLPESMDGLCKTQEGIVSGTLITDWTRPRVQIFYQTEDGQEITLKQWQKEKGWKKEKLKITLRVIEENFDPTQWEMKAAAYDRQGNREQSEEESVREANRQCAEWVKSQTTENGWKMEGWYETQAVFQEEANYEIRVQMKDFSGNTAMFEEAGKEAEENYEVFFTIDWTAPSFEGEVQYRRQDQVFLKKYPYDDYSYFSDQSVDLLLSARDRISGVKMIRYCFEHGENQEWNEADILEKGTDDMTAQISIPLGFQGAVLVEAVDEQGVIGEKQRLNAILTQKTEDAQKSSTLVISEEQEPYQRKGGTAYYAQEISLTVRVEDSVSGIKAFRCLVNGKVRIEEMCDLGKERTFLMQRQLILTEQDMEEDGILFEVWMETNSGYQRKDTHRYLIDSQKPEITVRYDREEGEGIFDRGNRTAYITVEDAYLDSDTVTISVESQSGEKRWSESWSVTESEGRTRYRAILLFEKEDAYTITVEGSDLSGNTQERKEETFILDHTRPVITVDKDFPQEGKANFYRAGGILSVSIQEEHFDADSVSMELLGKDEDGDEWREVWEGPWIFSENAYHSEKNVEKEGYYTFWIACRDAAGNVSEVYELEPFVIDKTPPQIVIENLANYSANKGKVEPIVFLSDDYLDEESWNFFCVGEKRGEKKMIYEKLRENGGYKVVFADFAYEKREDDLYTLELCIQDYAGNQTRKEVCFSVNRFGSVYTLSEGTRQFLEEYYQREAQTLEVTETNVDSVEENVIFCSREGEIRQLFQGKDYQVHVRGEEQGWKQYVYEIGKENFQEEGVYQLTFVSRDLAGNYSENQRKGEEIVFAIDHSSPTVTVSGIERGGRYKEEERSIWVDATDNMGLKKVSIYLNGVLWDEWSEGEWEQSQNLIIKENDSEQKLSVVLEDLAGNRSLYVTDHFLISSDSWIQFWHSHHRWSEAGILALIVVFLFVLFQKYQKKKFEFKW
ncbi:MAG: hypothetical protein SO016_11535 [Lachnospiraceae bacterium]|nr:hypothetical protein [Lachnospiraceae bacterium]